MVQNKLPLINSAHGSETRNIINELIKLFNGMGYTYSESLKMSREILIEAQQTNNMNKDVQQQINTLIAESGTSDAEVLQARGGFDVLNERFNYIADKEPVNLKDYKVHHLNTAEQNTGFIQQAIIDAEAEGRPIQFPWVPEGHWIRIDGPLTIATGGIEILTYGKSTRIQQQAFPSPVFDVIAPNVKINSFYASSTFTNGSGYTTTFRGHLHQSYHTAVAIYADNVTILDLKVHNYVVGVLAYAWDVENDVKGDAIENIKVHGLEVSEVNFGLLVQDVTNISYDNITGSYRLMPGIPTPPHLIYFVNGTHGNKNLSGGFAKAVNGEDGQAFQFKGVIDGEVQELLSYDTSGSSNFMLNKNLKVGRIASYGDTWDDQVHGSVYAQSENDGIEIDSITIEMEGNGKPFRFSAETSNSVARKINVKSKHTAYDHANLYDVDIQGTNNKVIDVDVENVGTVEWTSSVGIWGGTGNEISNPKTKGNIRSVAIRTGGGHTLKNYDPEKLLPLNQIALSKQLSGKVTLLPNNQTAYGISNQDLLLAHDRCDFPADFLGGIYMTTSGHIWNEITGLFKIDNKAIQSYSGNATLAVIDTDTNNIDLSSGIRPVSQEGLAVRVLDDKNYLFARLNNTYNRVELFKVINGTSTSLDSVDMQIDNGRRYQFRVVAFEGKVEVFVDGVTKINHTLTEPELTALNSATGHGLRTNTSPSGFYDNIEWRKID